MSDLYPDTEPHASGMLAASDDQEIYWEVAGNPDGKPAVVFHGGPGSGCTSWSRRLFDPAGYRVVLRSSGSPTSRSLQYATGQR
jgi:proline iminopeptidase